MIGAMMRTSRLQTGSVLGGSLLNGLTALALMGLAFTMSPSSSSLAQETSANVGASARVSVRVPQANGVVMLELVVKSFRKPANGNIGGVVRLKRGGKTIEVGRFSLFPGVSFASAGEEQRFQFNVGSALKQLDLSGGQAEVEVALIDRSNGKVSSDAALTIGNVQIVTR